MRVRNIRTICNVGADKNFSVYEKDWLFVRRRTYLAKYRGYGLYRIGPVSVDPLQFFARRPIYFVVMDGTLYASLVLDQLLQHFDGVLREQGLLDEPEPASSNGPCVQTR